MASDDEKIKTNSAAEHEAPPEKKSTSGAEASKADGGESAAASPPGYSRGEGQKPVSKAYRENWNVIFAKKRSDRASRYGCCERRGRSGQQSEAIKSHKVVPAAQATRKRKIAKRSGIVVRKNASAWVETV